MIPNTKTNVMGSDVYYDFSTLIDVELLTKNGDQNRFPLISCKGSMKIDEAGDIEILSVSYSVNNALIRHKLMPD